MVDFYSLLINYCEFKSFSFTEFTAALLNVKQYATTETTIFLLWVLHRIYCALHVVASVFWDYEINGNVVVKGLFCF